MELATLNLCKMLEDCRGEDLLLSDKGRELSQKFAVGEFGQIFT
jgi:hypothetical protein